jgi:polyphenol oxidase
LNPRTFTSDRRAGNARAPGALARLLRRRNWPLRAATAEQIHGHQVQRISGRRDARKWTGADGLLTDQRRIPLGIFTADCLPVFLSADGGRVIGVLHAGWRGLKKGILLQALRGLRRWWGIPARRVEIWTGPAIGRCCFEVGWDVARFFPATRIQIRGRWHVDLAGELRIQARRQGVRWRPPRAAACTRHLRRFFSYRRNATPDRHVSVIMKP